MPDIVYSAESGTRRVSSRSELLRADGKNLYLGKGRNQTVFDHEGIMSMRGDAIVWDEISQPVVGRNVLNTAGRVDYNYDELTLDFSISARYPDDPVGIVTQMQHACLIGAATRPHVHWMQMSDNVPNILIAYRWILNGGVPAAWSLKALTAADLAFPYSAGIQQISQFNLPGEDSVNPALSATFDCKIYRDTLNTSGLFAGADPYPTEWPVKYYDIHVQKDAAGSREEFAK